MSHKNFTKEFVCECCKQLKISHDAKTKWCEDCKKPKLCICGCGNLTKNPHTHPYAPGCKNRGKTYKEIYGIDNPGCGFKRGLDNPNYDLILKTKSNQSLIRYYQKNPDKLAAKLKKGNETRHLIEPIGNEYFRSQWEKDVFQILQKNNITFEREIGIPIYNGTKVVDFIVNNNVYIEVSGYSFIANKEKFKNKIKYLQEAVDKPVIIITNKSLFEEISKGCWYTNVFTSLLNEEQIIKKIRFCQMINLINKEVEDKWRSEDKLV